jgi:hypothetical protein
MRPLLSFFFLEKRFPLLYISKANIIPVQRFGAPAIT